MERPFTRHPYLIMAKAVFLVSVTRAPFAAQYADKNDCPPCRQDSNL